MDTPKVSAAKNSGLQDDHDPSDIGQRPANTKQQQSQKEGPAAYAPYDEEEKKGRSRKARQRTPTAIQRRKRRESFDG